MIFCNSCSSFFSFSPFTIPCRNIAPSILLIFYLASFSTIRHHLRQFTDYRSTHIRHTAESLMTLPFMNTDYSGKISVVKDYRERANALSRKNVKKEKERGHKNVRVIFHLHACRNPNLFFFHFNYVLAFLFLLCARPFSFQGRWLMELKTSVQWQLVPNTIFISLSDTFLNKLFVYICPP